MRGSSSVLQQYSAVTMFFNAGLQGFYRGGRVLKENPKKALPAVGLTIVAPEISLWMLNHDYREYIEMCQMKLKCLIISYQCMYEKQKMALIYTKMVQENRRIYSNT